MVKNIYINYKGEDTLQLIDKEEYMNEDCEVIVQIHNRKYQMIIDQNQANEIMKGVLACRQK